MGVPSYDSGFKRRIIRACLTLCLALLFEVWKQQWPIVSEVVLWNCFREVLIKWSKVSKNRSIIINNVRPENTQLTMCFGRYCLILSSHKQNEYINEGDTCIVEKIVVDYCGFGLLVPMGMIRIPNSRGMVIAFNSQYQDKIRCEGAWTEWKSESLKWLEFMDLAIDHDDAKSEIVAQQSRILLAL